MLLLRLLAIFAACMSVAAPALTPKDWNSIVVPTKEGGFLVGNAKAPHRLIEYFSLTCSHCHHFTEEGLPTLRKDYVATGKLSVEYRNFILNGPDLAASLLMRCTTPFHSMRLYDQIYADQAKLFEPATTLSADAQARITAAPEAERAVAFAKEIGMDSWFAAHGVPLAKGTACLKDPAGTKRILDLRAQAVDQFKVQGTPAFILDGVLINGADWQTLQTALEAVIK